MKRNFTSNVSIVMITLLIAFGTLVPFAGWGQEREVQGIVTDAAKEPIMGVSVGVKGGTQGTTTNAEGRFVLKVPTNSTLVFSFIGFGTQEVVLGNSNNVSVALSETQAQLDEVVVTALGIERTTKSLTYSTQQLTNADLTNVRDPGGNIMNSLSGKVAGAVVTPAATGPGGAVRIVLRGNRSISGNNNALIVVDGVPIDNTMSTEQGGGGSGNTAATQLKSTGSGYSGSDGAASINPEDVESITVLKGPAATALYGSRAANGALIITTKRGKSGDLLINYNGGVTVDNALMLMKLQNTYGQGNGGVLAETAAGSWGAATTTYPDNVKNFYTTGTTINNSINISGGTDKMQGYTSYSNSSIGGIIPENSLNRNTLNLRLNNEILEGLTTDVKLTYVNQKINNKPRLGGNGVTNEALIMPRDMSPERLKDFETIDPNTGQPIPRYWTSGATFQNPYWDVNRTSFDEERNRVMFVGSVKYQFLDWLSIQARFSLDRYDDKITGAYFAETKPVPTNPGGRYQGNHVNHWERNMDLLLSGSNSIGSDLGIAYNIGAAVLNNSGYNTHSLANGLRIPNKFDLNFATTPTFNNIVVKKEIQSVYANTTIDYKEQLFLDLSARNDWSSSLPSPHSYFYPAVGISALLSEMTNMPEWVTFSKIRGAYTQVGNDADPYLLIQTYSYSPGAGQGFIARDVNRTIADLKPERTEAWEFGTEWRFLDGRVGLDATVYKTNTVNQLIFVPMIQPSGFNTQYVNVGDIENQGIELMLNGNPVNTENFNWNTSINYALNKNKVMRLRDGVTEATLTTASDFARVLIRVGGSYGDLFGTVWDKDENGKHKVSSTGLPVTKTLQKIGDFNPDYTVGWTNEFTYKKFDMSFQIDGRVGGTLISGTDAMLGYFGVGDYTTAFRDGSLVLPGVKPDGSENTTAITAEQLWTQVSQGGTNAWAEFFAYDATNFRLRELSIGYRFDLNNSRLRNARVSLSAKNLFFLYRGKSKLNIPGIEKRTLPVDPESALGTSNYQGIENGMLPSTRSFGLNLSVSF